MKIILSSLDNGGISGQKYPWPPPKKGRFWGGSFFKFLRALKFSGPQNFTHWRQVRADCFFWYFGRNFWRQAIFKENSKKFCSEILVKNSFFQNISKSPPKIMVKFPLFDAFRRRLYTGQKWQFLLVFARRHDLELRRHLFHHCLRM